MPTRPGADELLDPVRPGELLEGVELLRRAGQLERDRVGAEVDDPALEGLGGGDQLGAALGAGAHLEQQQLALDRVVRRELGHAEHVDELVNLLLDLLQRVVLAVDAERDARDAVALGRPDGERVDVEPAPGEHRRDPGERARLVLEEHRDRVLHERCLHRLLVLDHVDRGGAGRDHREALLGRVDAAVDHDGAVERERLAQGRLELRLRLRRASRRRRTPRRASRSRARRRRGRRASGARRRTCPATA